MDYKQFRFHCQTGNLSMISDELKDLSIPEKAEYLRKVLQNPLRPEVLEYLGSEITRLPNEDGTSLLVELFYSEEAAARNMAVDLFPAFGYAALEMLKGHIADINPDVRLFVVMTLQQLPYKEEVIELLSTQLVVEKEMNVLVAIIEALGDLAAGVKEAELIYSVIKKYNHPYIDFVGKRALLRLGYTQIGIVNEALS